MKNADFEHITSVENAELISKWFDESGGIAVWGSLNLSDPGTTWTTRLDSGKPNWAAANKPELKITDPNQVGVVTYKEVKRFYVAVRRSSSGLMLKLTDGATRKVHRAVEKAGDGAIYEFDYFTQEAVILVPDEVVSLTKWREA